MVRWPIWPLLFVAQIITTHALVVNITETGAIETSTHLIALFGPDYPDFKQVTAPLAYAGGLLCPNDPAPPVPLNKTIVLIWRGSCKFTEKVYRAQQLGAVGAIVANNEEAVIIQMASDNEYGPMVKIPAISVSKRTGDHLVAVLQQSVVIATISETGEAAGRTPYDNDIWQAFEWVFYVAVSGVIVIVIAFTIRRYILLRRMRVVRVNYARRIPIVEYRAQGATREVEEKEVDARTPLSQQEHKMPRCLNETCAICLDDFEAGQRIKVLPCSHGFHIDCIDPWLNERSEHCPVCKSSIVDNLPPERAWYNSCWCCVRRARPQVLSEAADPSLNSPVAADGNV